MVTGPDVLLWTNYSDFKASREFGWQLPAIAVLGVGLGIKLRDPYAIVGMGSIGLIPLPGWLKPRRKVKVTQDEVRISRPPFWSHGLLWFPIVLTIMTGAIVGEALMGELGPRLLFVLVVGPPLIVALLVQAYRNRGPLAISDSYVRLGRGPQFELGEARIVLKKDSSGSPLIYLASTATKPVQVLLRSEPYGLDFNTLMSVLVQLQMWHADGRQTSPATIRTMLALHPEYPYPIRGNSVELAIPVPEPEAV